MKGCDIAMERVFLVWLAGIVLWQWVGNWEWKIPYLGREKLVAWRSKRHISRTFDVILDLSDASELERHYWKVMHQLPRWEIEQGGPLWLRLNIRVREGADRGSVYERRFSDVECSVKEY